MKAFWSLMAVLVAATIGLLAVDLDAAPDEPVGRAIAKAPPPPPPPAPPAPADTTPEPGSTAAESPAPAPIAAERAPEQQDPPAPEREPTQAADAQTPAADDAPVGTIPNPDVADPVEVVDSVIDAVDETIPEVDAMADQVGEVVAAIESASEEAPAEIETAETDSDQIDAVDTETSKVALAETDASDVVAPDPVALSVVDTGLGAQDPMATIAAAAQKAADNAPGGARGKVVRNADGSLLIDDRFTVPGTGTRADPYRISWDLLVAAEAVYAPRQGKSELPAWADELDGSFVSLPGYMLLPSLTGDVTELLVMLNPWDGCCIGVPPTPYDAAEIRLRQTIDQYLGGGAMYVNHATVVGKLDVDPYLAGGWLLGLYVINDADLVSSGGVGDTGN